MSHHDQRTNKGSDPFDAALARRVIDWSERAESGGTAANCPDAELLAAYYDRSLGRAERDRLETHFATCARCQAALAAMARADGGAVPAPPSIRAWRPTWRVAVPAIAAVLAVVVVAGVMRHGGREAPAVQVAALSAGAQRAPAESAAGPAAPAPNAEIALNQNESQATSVAPAGAAIAAKSEASPEPRSEPMALAPRALGAFGALGAAGVTSRMSAAPNQPAAGVPAPQALQALPQPPNAAPAAPPLLAAAESPRERAERSMSTAARLRVQSSTSSAAETVAGGASKLASSLHTPGYRGSVVVTSQQGLGFWKVGARGLIEQSDHGRTWHVEQSGVPADLLAGSSPSPTVCWAVGRGGTIVRTVDGDQWERTASSPTTADLIRVNADSADSASVTAADGSAYTTADGGKTWTRK